MTLEFQQADGQMDSPVQQFRYCAISRSLQSYYTSVPGQAAEVSSGGVTYKSKNIVYVYFSFFSLLLFFCVLFPLKLRTLEVFQLNFLCKTLDIYSFRFSKSEDTSDALVIASNTHTHMQLCIGRMQCKVKFNVCRKRPYPRVRQNERVTISREFNEVYWSCFRLRFLALDCAGFHFNLGESFIVVSLNIFKIFEHDWSIHDKFLTPQGGGTTRSPKQTRCRLATCRVGGDYNRSSFFTLDTSWCQLRLWNLVKWWESVQVQRRVQKALAQELTFSDLSDLSEMWCSQD